MVVFSTITEAVFLDVNVTYEFKFEQEKEKDSSEKEEADKKESKYLERLAALHFNSDWLSLRNYSSNTWIHRVYIDEEFIPPEV